jgi:hypothetical protein
VSGGSRAARTAERHGGVRVADGHGHVRTREMPHVCGSPASTAALARQSLSLPPRTGQHVDASLASDWCCSAATHLQRTSLRTCISGLPAHPPLAQQPTRRRLCARLALPPRLRPRRLRRRARRRARRRV